MNETNFTGVRRPAGWYFLVQGIAVLLWWLLLWRMPSARGWFRMGPGADPTLMAFCLPDLILLGAGSLAAGGLCLRGSEQAPAALWGVSEAVSYAALYCLGYAWRTDAGWWGVTLMLPAMLLSVASAVAVSPWSVHLFRTARPAGAAWNLTKTALQIVAFWGLFLFFVPPLLVASPRAVSDPGDAGTAVPFVRRTARTDCGKRSNLSPYLPIIKGILGPPLSGAVVSHSRLRRKRYAA